MGHEYRILVLQRGWVIVGRYVERGDECCLYDAAVIRRWGTTKGLGELIDGPTPSTTLDKCGEVRAHKLSVVLHLIASKKWETVLC